MAIAGNVPDWHIVWLPLIVALQFLFVISLGIWLSAINVFVRDLSLALPNLLTIILFITPIFYPIESMPALVQKLMFMNPFYLIADAYRVTLLQHQSPGIPGLVYVFVLALVLFVVGLAAFRRVKGFFDSAL